MYMNSNSAPGYSNVGTGNWTQEMRRLENAGQNVVPFTAGTPVPRTDATMPMRTGTELGMANMETGAATTDNALQMRNNLPSDVVEAPVSRDEVSKGSLKAMLARNEGNYIVATFLVGTQNMVSWEGILYDVGNDYVTIYQEPRDRYIVSDIYSLKFMEFYDTQRRDACNELLQQSGWRQS